MIYYTILYITLYTTLYAMLYYTMQYALYLGSNMLLYTTSGLYCNILTLYYDMQRQVPLVSDLQSAKCS